MLGHADVYTTARVYAHALNSDKTAVAEKWQAAMRRAQNSKIIEIIPLQMVARNQKTVSKLLTRK